MNKVFRKIHLWLSVPVGLIITVICLTGAALVFERDITESLDPELYKVTYTEGNAPLPPSELVAAIRRQVPDSLELLSLQLPGERDGVCMATFKGTGKRSLSVNPYTGEVNGWTKSYPFFQTMRKLHRWLMDPPAYKGAKSAGKVIVGVTTLVMVVILVSGVAIWVPRTRKALKNRLLVYVYEGMAALLVRQPCFAGHICHPVSAGHGPDRTYLVVPMVSHGGLRSVRGVDGPSRHVRSATAGQGETG